MTALRTKSTYTRRQRTVSPLTKRIVVGFGVLFLVGSIFAATWYGTRLPFFTITSITVSGGETIPHEEVRKYIEDELSGNYFFTIPHTFSYFYPHERIVEKLSAIPRIHSISVDRVDRHTLKATFEEYSPFALWCGGKEEGSTCLFLDERGYAFAEAPRLSGGSFTRYIDEARPEVDMGQAFDTATFSNVQSFIDRIHTELSLRVAVVTYTEVGDIELSVNGGGKVLISMVRDPEDTFDNLVTVLSSPEFEHIEPGNFQYIDLRFGNKVFVNETITPAETPATTTDAGTTTEVLPD